MSRFAARGFTVVEIVVVSTIVGIAASAAIVGVSATLRDAQVKSEQQRVLRELRNERTLTKDRLTGLLIEHSASEPGTLTYKAAKVTTPYNGATTCEALTASAPRVHRYKTLKLSLMNAGAVTSTVCLDEAGRPIDGGTFALKLKEERNALERGTITVEQAGSIRADFTTVARNDNGGEKDKAKGKLKKEEKKLKKAAEAAANALLGIIQ
jgi:prepilin-type N-terminal cleavage/methylation domain-containing protein